MTQGLEGLELLGLHRSTVFAFDARGRMVHESDPNRSRGKRFSFTGCRDGNLAVVRDDVSDRACEELERLLDAEPPFVDDVAMPHGLEGYLAALGVERPDLGDLCGCLWVFPEEIGLGRDARLVSSGTDQATALLGDFEAAMPATLRSRGFQSPTDLWEPWCAAVVDNRVASIAQTVRTGPGGAEVGVDTASELRGRGLAAAACAGWARHRELEGTTRFYSTGRRNTASRRVTERLGLTRVGSTFAIA